jgi:hypothetical protein
LTVPFGQMEGRPRMSEEQLQRLRFLNAKRYCAGTPQEPSAAARAPEQAPDDMGDPLVL